MSWHDFEKAAPDIAQIGKNLLYKPDRVEVAIFATIDLTGRPRVAPVSPIFSAQGVTCRSVLIPQNETTSKEMGFMPCMR